MAEDIKELDGGWMEIKRAINDLIKRANSLAKLEISYDLEDGGFLEISDGNAILRLAVPEGGDSLPDFPGTAPSIADGILVWDGTNGEARWLEGGTVGTDQVEILQWDGSEWELVLHDKIEMEYVTTGNVIETEVFLKEA